MPLQEQQHWPQLVTSEMLVTSPALHGREGLQGSRTATSLWSAVLSTGFVTGEMKEGHPLSMESSLPLWPLASLAL